MYFLLEQHFIRRYNIHVGIKIGLNQFDQYGIFGAYAEQTTQLFKSLVQAFIPDLKKQLIVIIQLTVRHCEVREEG